MRYRKKSVEIEAITFSELVALSNLRVIPDDLGWFYYNGHCISKINEKLFVINTLEGSMDMTNKDMLITGITGEIYPCKVHIFQETYDIVNQ